MPSLDFTHEHDYRAGPDDHSPEVQIRIFPKGIGSVPVAITAVLDSGASVSMFDKSLLGLFGIADIATGQKGEVRTANNEIADAFVHNLDIEFLGRQMTIPVMFSPVWPDGTPNLLGMKGFFEQLLIAFKHQERAALVAFI